MNGFAIAMICVFAAALIFIIVRAAVAYVRADKDGIIRVVPSDTINIVISVAAAVFFASAAVYYTNQAKPYKEFLDDLNARGTAPLAEYYGIAQEEFGAGTPEEQRPLLLSNAKGFCELAIKDYTNKRTLAILWAVECLILGFSCGAFITRNGKVYFMNKALLDDTSCEFFTCVKGKRIRFYDKEDSHKLPMSVTASGENLMLFNEFMQAEVLDNAKPAEQN